MTTYRTLAAALVFIFGLALGQSFALAADFRVENTVYVQGQTAPVSRGVTIFQVGLVYDFLDEPGEIIIFDKAHRRFILLDTGRRVRSEISMDDVQNFVNRVKQRLAGHPSPNVKWLADPVFDESFNAQSSELTLKGPALTYQARVQAADSESAAQYHEFSDWYAKFNLALDPKSRPPFPRMQLNDAIERHQGIAKEVHLTIASSGTPTKVTSRHQIATRLDASDMNRTAEAQDDMQRFKAVSFREYQQGK
jgi:hypothetical protein